MLLSPDATIGNSKMVKRVCDRFLFATRNPLGFLISPTAPLLIELASNRNVKLSEVKSAFLRTYGDLTRNHTMQMAAASPVQEKEEPSSITKIDFAA